MQIELILSQMAISNINASSPVGRESLRLLFPGELCFNDPMAKDLLDLHGFKSDEVEDAIDKFLMALSNSNLKRARIMTGKGTGTVRNLAIKYLRLAGYQWAYEKLPNGNNNEGCLIIFL